MQTIDQNREDGYTGYAVPGKGKHEYIETDRPYQEDNKSCFGGAVPQGNKTQNAKSKEKRLK